MSKDLSTKGKKTVDPFEKISEFMKSLEFELKNLRELYREIDPLCPSYEWLCGVRDGVALLTSELWTFLVTEETVDLASLREEVESISDSIKSCVRNCIVELHTLNRLPEFRYSRDRWYKIRQLG